jgi:hypothetical protein
MNVNISINNDKILAKNGRKVRIYVQKVEWRQVSMWSSRMNILKDVVFVKM